MPTAKIHLLTITPLGILIVYFTNGGCWQFRVLNGGSIYGHSKIYYTVEAAERAGREWVGSGW
jgi:hypothetical protein